MIKEFRVALFLLISTTVLTGLAYPLAVTGIAELLMPHKAGGSLIRNAQGDPIGSELIAQNFTRPEYFSPRPSAVNYDSQQSGATNAAPSSKRLIEKIVERMEAARAGLGERQIPIDMVTASGSGLDPHISPAAAYMQAPRIAGLRNMAEGDLWTLITAQIEDRTFSVLGEPRINVLKLNLALDRLPKRDGAVQ